MADQQIPSEIAVCPYCGGRLWFEVDEWDAETRVPTEAGVHVSCEDEDEPEPDHYQMPYVYWMPLTARVYRWLVRTGYTVPEHTPAEERAMLDAWNAGAEGAVITEHHPCSPRAQNLPYGHNEPHVRAGEQQRYCGACHLWQWAICADGWHDAKTDAELQAFYRRDSRGRPKKESGT